MNGHVGAQTVSAAHPVMEIAQPITCGRLSALIVGGAVRRIAVDGVEIVRGVDVPIRDENWGTAVAEDVRETLDDLDDTVRYRRSFSVFGGALAVSLDVRFESERARFELSLAASKTVETNRAGFTFLHPLEGVAGAAMTVVHSDGSEEQSTFPMTILAGQPAFDIAGLKHTVDGIAVDIAFAGEVFEMEDQRNWTDASFKTYCRPLSLPFPYRIEAGSTVTQSIEIKARGERRQAPSAAPASATRAPLPVVAMAATPAWLSNTDPCLLDYLPETPRLVRVDVARSDLAEAVSGMARLGGPIELELIVEDEGDIETPLAELADRMRSSAVVPASVVALPRAYLKSYQPSGPWPTGRGIAQAAASVSKVWPDAKIGAGMLTNFTELNRHAPPVGLGDFVTYSTCAIVHAADDRSVFETLEALPHVHQSAQALAGERPLRLGLASIGMRSNPYGAAVAENAELGRIAMAMDDPRQRTLFGAAFAVGAYAAAAECGVARIALAGIAGPFATGTAKNGRFIAWPIHHVVHALAAMAGSRRVAGPELPEPVLGVEVENQGRRIGVYANCGLTEVDVPTDGLRSITMSGQSDVSDPDWLDRAQPDFAETVSLAPGSVLFTRTESA